MDVLFILIPLALLLVGAALIGFIWAVNSGQFDDTTGPAVRLLLDDDSADETDPDDPDSSDHDPTDSNT